MTENLSEQLPDPEKEIREKTAEVLGETENSKEVEAVKLFDKLILENCQSEETLRKINENPEKLWEIFDEWQSELEKIADETKTAEGRIRKCVTEARLFWKLGNYAEVLDRLDNDALLQADQMGFDELGDEIYEIIKLARLRLEQK